MHKILLAALAVFLFVACQKTPDKIISINPDEFSAEDQLKIGSVFRDAIANSPADFPILDHGQFAEAYDYVSTLFNTVRNTALIENRTDYDWTVDIIQNDTLRTAFFLPGGHFYIYTGLLKYLDTESQFLGVVGHEMYYANAEVLVSQMKTQFGGVFLGDILLDKPVDGAASFALEMPYLEFDADKVLSADSFAVALVCPFNYDPLGIREVLEKTQDETNPTLHWAEIRRAAYAKRLSRLDAQSIPCGLPGVLNEAGYRRFKETQLP